VWPGGWGVAAKSNACEGVTAGGDDGYHLVGHRVVGAVHECRHLQYGGVLALRRRAAHPRPRVIVDVYRELDRAQ